MFEVYRKFAELKPACMDAFEDSPVVEASFQDTSGWTPAGEDTAFQVDMQEVAPDNQADGVEVPTCLSNRQQCFSLAAALHALSRSYLKLLLLLLKKNLQLNWCVIVLSATDCQIVFDRMK